MLAGPETVDGLPLRCEVAVLAPGGRGQELARPGATVPLPAPDPDSTGGDLLHLGHHRDRQAALFRERQLVAVQAIDLGPDAESVWDGGAPMLASTQFAHVGMTTKFPWYLRMGSTLHVMERWRPDDALRLVAEHRMPTIGVVAPQLALMLRSPLMDQLDLSCVRAIIAGVPHPHRRWCARGGSGSVRPTRSATPRPSRAASVWAPRSTRRRRGVAHRRTAATGVEVRIADEGDQPVPDGTVGELQLRSDAVMDGYWNDPAATAAALTPDRWLRTGDLARIDASGCVVLCGRRTDMYIRGGYNVFPSEVEAALADHPGVAQVAVVPRPDEVMGEIGVALVVPPTGIVRRRSRTSGTTPRRASDVTSCPRHWWLVDHVPAHRRAEGRPSRRDRVGCPRSGLGWRCRWGRVNQIVPMLSFALGVVLAWALTVPLHRYKELRPLTPP